MDTANLEAARILIVEDNPSDGELLLRQLNEAGFSPHVCVINDGARAPSFLEGSREDLLGVFFDLHLPSLGGLDILKRIRADQRLRSLPVVIMTSSNHPDEMESCHQLGIAGYVEKPVTFASFSKAIADTFHRPSGRRTANDVE